MFKILERISRKQLCEGMGGRRKESNYEKSTKKNKIRVELYKKKINFCENMAILTLA